MSKNTVSKKTPKPKAEVILLGLDIHAERQVAVLQIDGQTPQPAQRFTEEGLLKWVKKQLTLAKEVYTCYEEGPCEKAPARSWARGPRLSKGRLVSSATAPMTQVPFFSRDRG